MPAYSFAPPILTAKETASIGSVRSLTVEKVDLGPVLKAGERGAILVSGAHIVGDGNGGRTVGDGDDFDVDVVSGALLLFDRIDCPANQIIQINAEYPPGLEDWEGIQQSKVSMSGSPEMDKVLPETVASVLERLDEREPGCWTLVRGPTQEVMPIDRLSPLTGLQLKLQNALPLPDRSVPYEDVLSFKSRRTSELQALREYMDGIALEVAANGFGGFGETVAFEKFHRALADYSEVVRRENFAKSLLSGLEINFSISDAVRGVLSAGALAATAGLPLLTYSQAALYAGIGASIGLKRKRPRDGISPFEYVFMARREL